MRLCPLRWELLKSRTSRRVAPVDVAAEAGAIGPRRRDGGAPALRRRQRVRAPRRLRRPPRGVARHRGDVGGVRTEQWVVTYDGAHRRGVVDGRAPVGGGDLQLRRRPARRGGERRHPEEYLELRERARFLGEQRLVPEEGVW